MNPIGASVVAVCAMACVAVLTSDVVDQLVARRARRRLSPGASPRLRRRTWPRPLARRIDRRASARADRDLPLWLDASARSARAGASLRHALIDGATALAGRPLADDLRPFIGALAQGVPIGLAVDQQWTTSAVSRHRSLVWRALRLASRSGGPATAAR